jgi:hypothetical protein
MNDACIELMTESRDVSHWHFDIRQTFEKLTLRDALS